MAIIEVDHVTKEFQLGQLQSVKLGLQRLMARMNGHSLPPRRNLKALEDVHFHVDEGEVLGIIGSNGAGKSTILKILSRITVPSQGSVRVHGKVAPLIEVGAGLVGDLTGRENIFLNAAILGMSKKHIKRKFDEIVAFAELEDFIDTPIKRYSSGMSVRLGFSIATSVDADILIVDEVLAVGDLAFQRKCFDRMEDLIKRRKKTVILVSHNIRQVERLCSRVVLLDHGKVIADAPPSDVCNLFYERSDQKIKQNAEEMLKQTRQHLTSGEVELLEVQIVDDAGKSIKEVVYQDNITVVLRYRSNVELKKAVFGVGVHTTDFIYLATEHSDASIDAFDIVPGDYEIRCVIKKLPFLPGVYALRVGLRGGELTRLVFYAENVFFFRVVLSEGARTQAMQEGVISLESSWFGVRLHEQSVLDLHQTRLAPATRHE